MTTDPTGEFGKLAPVLAAHREGAIRLPQPVLDAIENVARLKDAAEVAEHAAWVSKGNSDYADDQAIQAMVKGGPTDDPSRLGRELLAEAKRDKKNSELVAYAADRAAGRVVPSFLDAAPDIAAQLVDALGQVVEAAREVAPALVGLDYSNPDAVHELPSEGASAYHAMDRLSVLHDAIRQAALALHSELSARDFGQRRAKILKALDDGAFRGDPRSEHTGWWMSTFVGAGIVGPAPSIRGTGHTAYASAWRWLPLDKGPVERLVEAALTPVPVATVKEPAPVLAASIKVPRVPMTARTPSGKVAARR